MEKSKSEKVPRRQNNQAQTPKWKQLNKEEEEGRLISFNQELEEQIKNLKEEKKS